MSSRRRQGGYDVITRLYDHEYRRYDGDVALYVERLRAARVRGRVADLGCGTGRVAVPLAAAGFLVTGVDLSEPMLRRARRSRSRLHADAAARLRFTRQDLTRLRLGEPHGAGILAFSTLNMLLTQGDRAAALTAILGHLTPGGLLLVDLFAPSTAPTTAPQSLRAPSSFRLSPWGHTVEKVVSESPRDAGSLLDVRYHYTVRRADGGEVIGEVESCFTLAPLSRAQAEAELEAAGFTVEAVYGDYRGGPFGPRSGRMILEARWRP